MSKNDKHKPKYDRGLFEAMSQGTKDDTPQLMTYFEFLDIYTDAWLAAESKTNEYPSKAFRTALGEYMDEEVVRRGGES